MEEISQYLLQTMTLASGNLSSTLSTNDIDTILSSHVVNKLVPAVSLYDGRKYQQLLLIDLYMSLKLSSKTANHLTAITIMTLAN